MLKEFEAELARLQMDLPFDESGCEAKCSDRSWPFSPLQRADYAVIMSDPPWRFVTWSQTRQYKAPSQHYAVMGLEQIKALPVVELAATDSLLWLWATQAQLHQAFAVMEFWGFEFKTAGAWAKQSPTGASWAFGTGYVLRAAFRFRELIDAGIVSRDVAEGLLLDAATVCGYVAKDGAAAAIATIRSGLGSSIGGPSSPTEQTEPVL